METSLKSRTVISYGLSFNFLASLINGNIAAIAVEVKIHNKFF